MKTGWIHHTDFQEREIFHPLYNLYFVLQFASDQKKIAFLHGDQMAEVCCEVVDKYLGKCIVFQMNLE
ncbi:hypothetical protein GDO78_014420 [Eleutherodactylus coqui]|uniref:Uncharacterized protein n=1 Tax=Eleutherodactylus coqui TaxID=57060 RepID=A0A8J6EEV1_ELECQ|nr:hypothetical protein GDO78_014420 [Eleutherodactylus coqui]